MHKTAIISHTILKAALLLLFTAIGITLYGQSQEDVFKQYTKERPLVIAAEWDFPPYDFRDSKGNPSGYYIEVMETILNSLGIPYTYVMRDWSEAKKLYDDKKADIIIAPVGKNRSKDNYYSSATLGPYNIVIAHRKGTKAPDSIEQLMAQDSLIFNSDDYAAVTLAAMGKHIPEECFCSPRLGLTGVASGKYKYYVFGEKAAEWFIKEQNIKGIKLSRTSIPNGQIRIIGHDKNLIEVLDDKYVRLDQNGTINSIHDKWLHPERHRDNESSVSLYIIFSAAMLILLTITINYLLAVRRKKRNEELAEISKIMERTLKVSKNKVVIYDIKKRIVKNIYGSFIPEDHITFDEYYEYVHPGDRNILKQFIDDLTNCGNDHLSAAYRWNIGSKTEPEWRDILDMSVVEYDHSGTPINIISTLVDITEDNNKEREAKHIIKKFSTMLNMSLVGIALYDSNGQLLATNTKMREIFKFKHLKDEFYYNTRLFDLPFIDNRASFRHAEQIHLCTRKCILPHYNLSDYIELRIRPIKDENGKTIYILIKAQDIQEEYQLHKKQKNNDAEIRKVNKEAQRYQEELRYLLQQSNMRVWRSSFDTQQVNFFKDLDNPDVTVGFEDIINNTDGEDNKTEIRKVIGMQKDLFGSHRAILPIKNLSVIDDTIHWYSIISITDYDHSGNATGCFGLIRDVSELINAQEKLKEETIRANNSKQQKSVFLANMTHEIRTPLNAIVGFCDLLQAIDSPDDRKEFIRIIRNNCDMLLHLINDILAVSSIDHKGLCIAPRDVDFASLFNDTCLTLSRQIPSPDKVTFIKENPYTSLIVELDRNRIKQIVTNFVTNAIKHTPEGHIRVGYQLKDNGIYIYCEDTGNGIPKDRCDDVFKRFVKLNDYVQGTGLGLSICKAIAEACNGDIGVTSDVGQGSTFWYWQPCDVKSFE